LKNAAKVANIPLHINRFTHNLNIASGNVMEIREVANMLAKIRLVVGHLDRSNIRFTKQ